MLTFTELRLMVIYFTMYQVNGDFYRATIYGYIFYDVSDKWWLLQSYVDQFQSHVLVGMRDECRLPEQNLRIYSQTTSTLVTLSISHLIAGTHCTMLIVWEN
jgi:hypothetical protein